MWVSVVEGVNQKCSKEKIFSETELLSDSDRGRAAAARANPHLKAFQRASPCLGPISLARSVRAPNEIR